MEVTIDDTHTYTINGSSKGTKSVTEFLDSMFEQFDPDDALSKMREYTRITKYKGLKNDAIKKLWETNNDAKRQKGVMMHKILENFFLGKITSFDEEILKREHLDEFLDYMRDYEILKTEFIIGDPHLKLGGTIDALFIKRGSDVNRGGLIKVYLVDWKRVEFEKHGTFYKSGICGLPLEHIVDTKFNHFTVQLNLYKYLLHEHTNYRVERMSIVRFHPAYQRCTIIDIEDIGHVVDKMVAHRRRELDEIDLIDEMDEMKF